MGAWVKRFVDGKFEVGTDYDVSNKKASWTKGRLDWISSVEIHDGKIIVLEGTGSFWQSDDLEARLGINESYNIVTRRIQKQLTWLDGVIYWSVKGTVIHFKIGPALPDSHRSYHMIPIDSKDWGKWFTLELDIKTGKVTYSIQENRI